jgi:hypothetical protein
MEKGCLAGNLGRSSTWRGVQILDGDFTASLAVSYLDGRGIPIADLARIVLADWNRSNVGPLISFARIISIARPEFRTTVRVRHFRGLFARAVGVTHSRLEREKTAYRDALTAEGQLRLIAAVMTDAAAEFAAVLGVREPSFNINRVVCPQMPVWGLLD